MTNKEIAKLLRQIAAAYSLKNENRFKIIAYERAADIIQKSSVEIKDLWENKQLKSLTGIGPAIFSHLEELFQTGKVKHFEKILSDFPASMFPLLDVPSFGPKKAYKLVTTLGLKKPKSVIQDLLKAAKKGKIRTIEGFGEKSEKEIIEALQKYQQGSLTPDRMPLSYASAIAKEIIEYCKLNPSVIEAVPLGSLRRKVATIGDIDIAISTRNPIEVIDWFLKYPKIKKIIEKGYSGTSVIINSNQQIDLRVQNPSQFGSMLQYFTGNKNHNIKLREYALRKGFSLSEYGIKILNKKNINKNARNRLLCHKNYNSKLNLYEFDSEKKFYQAMGLSWIPPELREDNGEIEAAISEAQGKSPGLPKLIELKDIKGDLHIHSDYNLEPSHDLGLSSLKEILSLAKKLNYEYVGISDHNPSIRHHTTEQIISILKRRKINFEHFLLNNKDVRVKLFIMLEVDILPDGKIALPEEAIKYLDAMIVSVHSSFKIDKERMTQRIISGLSHPKAKILAHPSGRRIGKREAYQLNWSKLFTFCQKKDKAIEINAYPDRLDLSDIMVKQAISNKVKLIINTDSHQADQMRLMDYGVSVARRGWATKDDIINTLPYNKFVKWLTSTK